MFGSLKIHCGSEPAREGGMPDNIFVDWYAAFASKPAPTEIDANPPTPPDTATCGIYLPPGHPLSSIGCSSENVSGRAHVGKHPLTD
ncbi:protein of unknown function [Pseudomonas mediterranea]